LLERVTGAPTGERLRFSSNTMTQVTIEQAIQIALEHHQAGRLAEAEAIYRQILAIDPNYADALNLLGVLAGQVGHLEPAIELIQRAIAIDPTAPHYHANLGETYRRGGQWPAAISAHTRSVELQAHSAKAYNDLGVALFENIQLDEAIAAFRKAIQLDPEYADAHTNLGAALNEQGRLDDAIGVYNRALELKSDSADALNNLGYLFKEQCRLDEAVACFRKAVAVDPGSSHTASNLLSTLHYHPDYDALALLAEHLQWACQYAEPLAGDIRPFSNDRTPDRKLRIGFVSPDFRGHPVGRSLLPLFAHHDRGQAEFIAYADVRAYDDYTQKFQALADGWRQTLGQSDAQVAEQIRTDRIDILVDLALHTGNNRLLVFARRPAPVQVAMLGMITTTGLATIDYRLSDPYLDPPGPGDTAYSERTLRLPRCCWCYEPPAEAPSLRALPALRNGVVTFGCLNHFSKVSPAALQAWLAVLQALPGARLLIHSQPGSHLDAVRALFEKAGIAGDRIEFPARVPRAGYFDAYHQLDIGLDPFPYNGAITTLDTLWMGVPVITLAGRTAVGRAGLSILSNLQLPELIARTPEQYVEAAIQLAGDLARLSELRTGLRERMRRSGLMDSGRYAAEVDAAYRTMWKTWCAR
jgi:predicted O-linked N-acetylglucosamine transferase (SPINDLY family)